MFTRQMIESMNYWERPKVRAVFNGRNVQADIAPYLSRAVVFVREGGKVYEFDVSWSLALAVLNDPKESPIAWDIRDSELFRKRIPHTPFESGIN